MALARARHAIIAIGGLAIHDLHISNQRFAGYVAGIGARMDVAHSLRRPPLC